MVVWHIIRKMEISTKRASYIIIPELGIVVNTEISNDFSHIGPEPINESALIDNLRRELTDEEIEAKLSGLSNITFNITDECNFRCRYCSHSGIYKGIRVHNLQKLNLNFAKKMIEHLLNWITGKNRNTRTPIINIGFYGGEALLEFQLVKDIMFYAIGRLQETGLDDFFEFHFRLNTNGYLLNDVVVDFLVDHEVTIDISLDGPQNEHDKFRVTKDRAPTWLTIWENINRIKERHPDYYTNKVHFLCTLHPLHDTEKIDRFFIDNKSFFDMERIRASYVNLLFLRDEIKKNWYNYENSSLRSSILAVNRINALMSERLGLKELNHMTKFTGMCSLGEIKYFVSSDGFIHICERVKSNLPIGHVDNGIDFDAIREIYRQWNEEIIRNRCWECRIWSICSKCLTQNEAEKGIRVNCNNEESRAKRRLTQFINSKEEEMDNVSYEHTDDVKEYLRRLE